METLVLHLIVTEYFCHFYSVTNLLTNYLNRLYFFVFYK